MLYLFKLLNPILNTTSAPLDELFLCDEHFSFDIFRACK
jgi:hypothetical protein